MRIWPSQLRHLEPPKSKSGLRGVIFCRWVKNKPWKAYIRRHGQYINLGYYATKQEAARAYNAVARSYHGARTYLNPV